MLKSSLAQTEKETLYSDPGYTGSDVDPNSLTRFADLDYYRNKILEFQKAMNAADETIQSLTLLLDQIGTFQGPLLPDDQFAIDDARAILDEFNGKKGQFRAAATAINAASETANALGVRMPVVSVPQTLQLAPIAIAAIAGAVALGASLIIWLAGAIPRARAAAGRVAMIESMPAELKAEAIKREQEIALAEAHASESPLVSIAGVVKWVAIGAAIWFGYQAFTKWKG